MATDIPGKEETPEEKIERLSRDIEKLQQERPQTLPRRSSSLFADVLEMENGHTVWARTRRMQMTPVAFKTTGTQPQQIYLDGGTDDLIWMCTVPTDWVRNTSITVNTYLHTTVAGTTVAVMRSFIGLNKEGDTYALDNFETDVGVSPTLSQNIVYLMQRTITGTSIEPDDSIEWRLRREGGDVNDTVGGTVLSRGAWLEYTAFM